MNLLLAMKQGEPLDRLLELAPSRMPRRTARDKHGLLQSLQQPYEAIVLHVELFADAYPWEWMAPLREMQPDAKVIVLTSDAVYDSLWQEVLYRLAAELGFVVSPLGLTAEEAASFAWRELFGAGEPEERRSRGIVAAVWSAACKDGATTVAANAAAALAKQTPLRVGLLDLNFKNPELRVQLQLPDAGSQSVPLRSKLQTGTLLSRELMEATTIYRKNPNLRVLPGTYRRDTAGDWSPVMIASLLDVCREAFDVTIADVSSYPDNAATVCAVRSADLRWLVAQNRRSSYMWSWSEWYECYWRLCGVEPEQIQLIINRPDSAGEKPEKAAASMRMELAGILPAVSESAARRAAEESRLLAEAAGAEAYAAAVTSLAGRLSVAAGGQPLLEPAPVRRGSRWPAMLTGLWKGGSRRADVVHETEGAF